MCRDNQTARSNAYRKFRKRLLGGTALVAALAVGVAVGVGSPNSTRAQTVVDDAATITATDATGISFVATDNGADAATVTIDPTGDITLGADAVSAFVNNSADGDADDNLTLNILGTETVTFAGDVISGGNNAFGTIAIVVGSTNAAATVVFQGNLTENNAAAMTIVLGDNANTDTQTVTFDSAFAESLVIAATINDDGAAADTSIVNVLNSNAGANTITFSDAFGTTQAIDQLNVGSATVAGTAIFSSATATTAVAITVTGGDAGGENSSAEFQDAVTATSMTLNDGAGTATININTTNGAQAIAGTVDGAAAGEGTLGVFDDDAGESDLATFGGNIGATQSLLAINIGTATQGGDANFAGTSAATTLTITGGDAANENAGLVAVGTSTITNLNLVGGGDATADATAQFQATGATLSTTAISLDDATGQAELTFNATNGVQTVTGTVDGAAAGEGKLRGCPR